MRITSLELETRLPNRGVKGPPTLSKPASCLCAQQTLQLSLCLLRVFPMLLRRRAKLAVSFPKPLLLEKAPYIIASACVPMLELASHLPVISRLVKLEGEGVHQVRISLAQASYHSIGK